MRSEIASVVTHFSGYGNVIVNGREKNQWLKSISDRYYGFSEHFDSLRPYLRIGATRPNGVISEGQTLAQRSMRPSVRHLSHCLGLLAQLVEQRTFNPWVEGSIPSQSI